MLDYQDYRYILQDAGTLYVGAKFTFGDIAKEEEIPFKFRSIVMRHLMTEVDKGDTFESVQKAAHSRACPGKRLCPYPMPRPCRYGSGGNGSRRTL